MTTISIDDQWGKTLVVGYRVKSVSLHNNPCYVSIKCTQWESEEPGRGAWYLVGLDSISTLFETADEAEKLATDVRVWQGKHAHVPEPNVSVEAVSEYQ